MSHRQLVVALGTCLLCFSFSACTSPSRDGGGSSQKTDAGGLPQTVDPTCDTPDGGEKSTDAGDGCTCPEGYLLDVDTCRLVDLCAADHGGCDSNATCTPGINTRTCTCKTGYTGDGMTCTPKGSGCGTCDAHATCQTVDGQPHCVCTEGYEGDGTSCTMTTDNPCAVENGGCSPNATCHKNGPGVACSCNTGYQGDGYNCQPIPNPCLTGNGGCSSNATCTPDDVGGRNCTCNTNYQGDGFTCTPWNMPLGGQCTKYTDTLVQSDCANGLVCMSEGQTSMCTQTDCSQNSDCGFTDSLMNVCLGVDGTYCFVGCDPFASKPCSRSGWVCTQGLDSQGRIANYCDADCRGLGTDWCGASGTCNASTGRCEVKTCTTSANCGTGKVCGTVKNSPKVCVWDCRTTWCPTGATCNQSTGLCDVPSDFYNSCTENTDCAANELCVTYTSTNGICTPTCTSNSQCPQDLGASQCNVTLSDNVTKVCTLPCSGSVSCPFTASCTGYNQMSICLPP